MTTTAPRTRTGCTSCRVRHLKCDEQRPVCRRCQRANRECVRGYNVRFRYGTDLGEEPPAGGRAAGGRGGEFRFERDQVWCDTLGQVSFVDETSDVTRNYDGGLSPVGSPPPHTTISFGAVRQVAIRSLISPSSSVASPPSDGGGSRGNSAVHSPIDEPAPREFESCAYQMDESPRDGNSSIGRRMETRRLPLSDILIPPPQKGSPLTSPPPSRRSTYDEPMDEGDHEMQRIAWPLEDHRDAMLLRHFITHLGKLYDIHDSKNHFQTVVPLESASNPMLLSAMLALAARHLTHTGDYDPTVANHYYRLCLKRFVPALEPAGASLEPAFLATTVLLRTYEEFDSMQDDSQVSGGYVACASSLFHSAPPHDLSSSSLREACFWIHLRQEITSSFLSRRPVSTHLRTLRHSLSQSSASPSRDHALANEITLLTGELVSFAFSSHWGSNYVAWEHLREQVASWHHSQPTSFQVLYQVPRDVGRGKWWPAIWYTLPHHATAMQYYHLSQLLLALYNPSFPRISSGPGVTRDATAKVVNEVVDNVRAICGIAQGNGGGGGGAGAGSDGLVAAVVDACKGWFEDPAERLALDALVKEMERGWPKSTRWEA